MISKEMIQNIIRSEVQTSSKKWVRFSRLAGILSQHGIEIEAEYFYNNPDFRIYRTENINIFFVSLPEYFPQCPKKHRPVKRRNYQSKSVHFDPIVINSPESFKQACRQILVVLTQTQPSRWIKPEILSNKFYLIYKKPIKQVRNQFFANKNLKDLLHESSLFTVRQSSETPTKWEVTIAANIHPHKNS